MDNTAGGLRSWTTSNLWRVLDPAYKTNLALILLTVAAGAVTTAIGFLRGGDLAQSLLSGSRMGLYLFLCWALTREIDPDHEGSAFLSMAAGLALLGSGVGPALVTGFWLLGLLRVLNRTTGRTTTYLDSFLLFFASLWLAWVEDWVLGIVGGTVFILDGFLDNPALRHRRLGGVLIASSLALWLTGSGQNPARVLPTSASWMVLPVSLLLLPLFVASKRILSKGDASDLALNAVRVQVTQLSMLVIAILLLARVQDGWAVSVVDWAVLIGAGIWSAGTSIVKATQGKAPP